MLHLRGVNVLRDRLDVFDVTPTDFVKRTEGRLQVVGPIEGDVALTYAASTEGCKLDDLRRAVFKPDCSDDPQMRMGDVLTLRCKLSRGLPDISLVYVVLLTHEEKPDWPKAIGEVWITGDLDNAEIFGYDEVMCW